VAGGKAGSVEAMRLYREILKWREEHERDEKPDPLADLFGFRA
jgi:hypothetical protein